MIYDLWSSHTVSVLQTIMLTLYQSIPLILTLSLLLPLPSIHCPILYYHIHNFPSILTHTVFMTHTVTQLTLIDLCYDMRYPHHSQATHDDSISTQAQYLNIHYYTHSPHPHSKMYIIHQNSFHLPCMPSPSHFIHSRKQYLLHSHSHI